MEYNTDKRAQSCSLSNSTSRKNMLAMYYTNIGRRVIMIAADVG